MRWAPDINNTLSTNQMSNAFQNNFSAQIFCENIWRSFNIESFLSRTANIAKRVCVSKVNVVSLKYLKVSSFYRTDCYIHQKVEAWVGEADNKNCKNCESCPTQVTWKSMFKCQFCLSCLSLKTFNLPSSIPELPGPFWVYIDSSISMKHVY